MACRLFGTKPVFKPMLGYCPWTLRNKLQYDLNQNSTLFIHENTSEYIVCEMVAICPGGELNDIRRQRPISLTVGFTVYCFTKLLPIHQVYCRKMNWQGLVACWRHVDWRRWINQSVYYNLFLSQCIYRINQQFNGFIQIQSGYYLDRIMMSLLVSIAIGLKKMSSYRWCIYFHHAVFGHFLVSIHMYRYITVTKTYVISLRRIRLSCYIFNVKTINCITSNANAGYFLKCSHVCFVNKIYGAKVKRWILFQQLGLEWRNGNCMLGLRGQGVPLKQPKHEKAFKLIAMCWLTTPTSNNA